MSRAGPSSVTVVSLFPSLLGTYGDGGNALILQRRCQWRAIDVELIAVNAGDAVPTGGDIYLLGGGEDGSQLAAMNALRGTAAAASSLSVALEAGAQMLAVCAGLQLLGHSFADSTGATTPGLALLDVTTGRLATRAVGELLADPDPTLGIPALSGFENHGGHTVLGPAATPLGLVRRGTGNGPAAPGEAVSEGALQGGIVATYLHGPVLARNPALADLLIARAMGIALAALTPLAMPEHDALRSRIGMDTR